MDISDEITKARKSKGITRARLSRMTGVPNHRLERMESEGDYKQRDLNLICRALRLDIDIRSKDGETQEQDY